MSDPYDDQRLRADLFDAVSDVDPDPALDRLQRRTRRRRTVLGPVSGPLLGIVGAAATVAAIVGGIALVANRDDGSTPAVLHPAPTGIPTNARTDGPVQRRDLTVPVYYVGDAVAGKRLFREFRTYQGVIGWSRLRVAVSSSVLGDSTDADYTSVFPEGTTARVSTGDDGVTVDLHGDADAIAAAPPGGTDDGAAGLQAVVHTVDAVLQQAVPVRFRVNGSAAATVLGVGTGAPVARGAAEDVLAPVWIIDPGNQAGVGRRFTVTGVAATFEANVVWELRQGDRVVRHGFTTAQECCKRSPYSFTVTAPPGTYDLVVHDSDESGDGGPVNADSHRVTVR